MQCFFFVFFRVGELSVDSFQIPDCDDAPFNLQTCLQNNDSDYIIDICKLWEEEYPDDPMIHEK